MRQERRGQHLPRHIDNTLAMKSVTSGSCSFLLWLSITNYYYFFFFFSNAISLKVICNSWVSSDAVLHTLQSSLRKSDHYHFVFKKTRRSFASPRLILFAPFGYDRDRDGLAGFYVHLSTSYQVVDEDAPQARHPHNPPLFGDYVVALGGMSPDSHQFNQDSAVSNPRLVCGIGHCFPWRGVGTLFPVTHAWKGVSNANDVDYVNRSFVEELIDPQFLSILASIRGN